MLQVYKEMVLSDVIEDNPALIPLLDRFGIPLGLSEATVDQVCRRYEVDTEFFITVVDTFLNEDYFPHREFAVFHAGQIAGYLRKTYKYYRELQLPNIERHLRAFEAAGAGENPSLKLISDSFDNAKKMLLARMERDEKEFFPRAEKLGDGRGDLQAGKMFFQAAGDRRNEGGELLQDIRSVMVKHLGGDYDRNLCYAVVFAVSALEHDLRQHDRIRDRILEPMVRAMEKNGR